MLTVGHFLSTFIDIIGLWVLFDRFKMVKGWTIFEVGLIYGIVQMGFSIAEAFARGFDMFHHMVKQGEFDRCLLRPINPLFQVALQEVQIMRVGRLLQGLCVLTWSAYHMPLSLFDAQRDHYFRDRWYCRPLLRPFCDPSDTLLLDD